MRKLYTVQFVHEEPVYAENKEEAEEIFWSNFDDINMSQYSDTSTAYAYEMAPYQKIKWAHSLPWISDEYNEEVEIRYIVTASDDNEDKL